MLMDRTDNGAKTRAWAVGHAVDRYGSSSMPPFLAKIKVMELLIPAAGNALVPSQRWKKRVRCMVHGDRDKNLLPPFQIIRHSKNFGESNHLKI